MADDDVLFGYGCSSSTWPAEWGVTQACRTFGGHVPLGHPKCVVRGSLDEYARNGRKPVVRKRRFRARHACFDSGSASAKAGPDGDDHAPGEQQRSQRVRR